MVIYFLTAIVSLGCIYFGLSHKVKSKWQSRILLAIGILLPCVLAAFRAVEIGTDTGGYISRLFETAKKTDNLGEYFSIAKSWYTITDPLYVVLNYVVAHTFGNFNVFLFIAEILVIVPIFIALKKGAKSRKEVLFGMTLFFLFEYNATFNILRQGIAISFVILMIHYLVSNKKLKSLICILVATGFHSTAFICLPLLPIYWIFKRTKARNRQVMSVAICVLLVTLVVFFEGVVMFLYNSGIYQHGKVFLDKYSTPFDFSFIDTATYLVPIVIYWIYSKRFDGGKSFDYDFYMLLGVGSLILLSLGWRVMFLERVSFYFFYPFLLYVIPRIARDDDSSRIVYSRRMILVLLIYFVLYWVVVYAVLNTHNTVPYKLGIFGVA